MAKIAKKLEVQEVPVAQEVATINTRPTPPAIVGADTIRAQDLMRPQIRLLQATSKEVTEQGMKAGTFLMDVLNIELGTEFEFTVLAKKVRGVLWNPQRGVDPMIFAQTTDMITWDDDREGKPTADRKFEAMIKNVGKVVWDTRESVAASGLLEFGSSVPSDPNSKPACAETHDFLIYIHGQRVLPAVMSLSRSKMRQARKLTTIAFMGDYDAREVKVKARAIEDGEGSEKFYNVSFSLAGDAPDFDKMIAMSQRFAAFVVQDAEDDGEVKRAGPSGKRKEGSEY